MWDWAGGGGGGYAPPPTDKVLNEISQEFEYAEIQNATSNFSTSNRLGEGSYGTVFRGVLRDGTEVAIKALSQPKEGGFKEEVQVLSKFRHPNLVILLGFARGPRKERYLVYEFLDRGDVHARMEKDREFTWEKRLSCALDASLGLSHLHGSKPQVFHRDVKTQNILMDKNGTAKVADFGLALLAEQNKNSMKVAETSGTIGYADPNYIRSGVVTEKSEVYSIGMVILELLTGRPPALQHPTGRIEYQFEHVKSVKDVFRMLDRRANFPVLMVEKVADLALKAIHPQEQCRPTFVQIVKLLREWLRDKSLHGVSGGLTAGSSGQTSSSNSSSHWVQQQQAAAGGAGQVGNGAAQAQRANDPFAGHLGTPVQKHAAAANQGAYPQQQQPRQGHQVPQDAYRGAGGREKLAALDLSGNGARAGHAHWQSFPQQQMPGAAQAKGHYEPQRVSPDRIMAAAGGGDGRSAGQQGWAHVRQAAQAGQLSAQGRGGESASRQTAGKPKAPSQQGVAHRASGGKEIREEQEASTQYGADLNRTLQTMGFTAQQAEKAAARCSTVDKAVEYITENLL
jgi:serine/threonine protein kinase